jgi:hypothetical protein
MLTHSLILVVVGGQDFTTRQPVPPLPPGLERSQAPSRFTRGLWYQVGTT